jgi:magnesium chelatase family protein
VRFRSRAPGFTCNRKPNARCAADYRTRISGPLLDDLHIEVPAVTAADLILPPPTEGSRKVERVHLAETLSYRALTDEIRRAA